MKHRMTRCAVVVLWLAAMPTAQRVQAEPPAWLDDAANSKWLLFGPTGVAENRGISPRDKGGFTSQIAHCGSTAMVAFTGGIS